MTTVVSIDPRHPGAYAPLLAGSLPADERGVPVALGCEERAVPAPPSRLSVWGRT